MIPLIRESEIRIDNYSVINDIETSIDELSTDLEVLSANQSNTLKEVNRLRSHIGAISDTANTNRSLAIVNSEGCCRVEFQITIVRQVFKRKFNKINKTLAILRSTPDFPIDELCYYFKRLTLKQRRKVTYPKGNLFWY